MRMLICACLAIVATASSLSAQPVSLTSCPPRSIDGTQVRVHENSGGSCEGKQPIVSYVADYELRVLCSTNTHSCVKKVNFNAQQAQLYHYLSHYRTPVHGFKKCSQSGSNNWIIHMATAGQSKCSPLVNGIRSVDRVMQEACVRIGGFVVGCTPLEEEQTIAFFTN